MNPYKVLGIPKNASAKRIKDAYRRLAMETHPDRFGDAVAFQEVLLAFKVLSDEKRRRLYDETGKIDRGEPDNSRSLMAGVLAQALGQIVGQLAGKGMKIVEEDLVALMRDGIENALATFRKQKEEGTRTREAAAAALGRFSRADGDPLLEEILAHAVASADAMLKKLDGAERVHKEALAYLKECTFKHDEKKVELYFSPGAWRWTTTTR